MSEKRYRVIFDRSGCIGAATCEAANPERWSLADDGKANLKGSEEKENNVFELVIDECELERMMDAAQACPVNVIHIEDLETGERLI